MTKAKWDTDSIQDQSGRIIIITGSTSGIGKEAARVLAGKNADVILAVRNVNKGEKVAAEIHNEFRSAVVSVRELDLASLESIKIFGESFQKDYDRLDVLINNAGIMMCPYSKTKDGFEIQMGTNHLGHFALTGHLLPLLEKTEGSRIVNVSSIGHRTGNINFSDINWEQRKYKPAKAYGDSKLANLYFTYELGNRLKSNSNNPLVTAAHPGWTATELQRHSGLFSFFNKFLAQGPDMGALPTLRAATDPKTKSGDYFGPAKHFEMHGYPVKVKSNQQSHDRIAARELWKQSEELTGLSY